MADPVKYTKGFNYSGFQASNPSTPLPAPQVDNDLSNIQTSLNQAIDAIKDLRRSDGAMKNGIVTIDALAPDVMSVLGEAEYLDVIGENIASVITVAGIAPNVTTVAGISAAISALAPISANITTVAGIASNVTTVAGISAAISALAPISANITTVAGIAPNVTTVAGMSGSIASVIANMNAIQNAAANANSAAQSAASAAASAQAAATFDPSSYYTKAQANALLVGKFDKAGGDIAGDLTIYRPSIPTQGYTFYGSNGQRWVGYDGTQYVMNGAGLTLGGNLTAGAAVFGTDGNLTGTVWQAWGSQYAQEAISNRISGFSSGQLTPTLGGLVQAAHGLGVKPRYYQAFLQCVTADFGWSVGDEVFISSDGIGSANGHGVEVYADATNIYGRVGSHGVGIKFIKNTGASQILTLANWRVVLRARA